MVRRVILRFLSVNYSQYNIQRITEAPHGAPAYSRDVCGREHFMELRHLRSFVTIARVGSFSRAAEQMHIAQPALSQQIRQLEDELGVSLFDRHARGVRLSRAGDKLLVHAMDILGRVNSARTELQMLAQEVSGEVRLGLPTTVIRLLGSMIRADLEEAFPGIKLQIIEGMSGYLCEWMANGELDAAILYDRSFYPEYVDAFQSSPILREDFRLIVAPHETGLATPVPIGELERFEVVLPRRLHAIRTLIDDFVKEQGITLNLVSELDSLSMIVDLVRAGHVTLLPGVAVGIELESGLIQALEISPAPSRTLHAAWRTEGENPRATAKVVETIHKAARRLMSQGRWGAYPI